MVDEEWFGKVLCVIVEWCILNVYLITLISPGCQKGVTQKLLSKMAAEEPLSLNTLKKTIVLQHDRCSKQSQW